jgi:hypothetical protein
LDSWTALAREEEMRELGASRLMTQALKRGEAASEGHAKKKNQYKIRMRRIGGCGWMDLRPLSITIP